MASLSEQPDQLSQWRAYAHDELGYALRLELRDAGLLSWPLVPPEAPTPVRLRKMIYGDATQEELYESLLVPLCDSLQESGIDEPNSFNLMQLVGTVLAQSVVELSLRFKHHAFHEEREWRLVLLEKDSPKDSGVFIRDGQFVPYASLPLRRDGSLQQWDITKPYPQPVGLQITGVTVGPTSEPELAVLSTQRMAELYGWLGPPPPFRGLPIEPSRIPLRRWR